MIDNKNIDCKILCCVLFNIEYEWLSFPIHSLFSYLNNNSSGAILSVGKNNIIEKMLPVMLD